MLEADGAVARITSSGASVTVGDHRVTFAASALGRIDGRRTLETRAIPTVSGAAVQTHRAPGVVEWWRALPSGLEHGVTLAERPMGEGALTIDVAITGDLSPRALSDDAIELRDASGACVAIYAHLVVVDAAGARVPARLTVREPSTIALVVDDAGARYPLVVDPLLIIAEEAALLASDGAGSDNLGYSLALSSDGSRALVGAYFDDTSGGFDAGSAHVYLRTGTTWIEEAILLASDGAAIDYLGSSVAISADGTRALVGAPGDDTAGGTDAGSVRVFLRSGTTWIEDATLLGPSLDYARFGASVAISADGTRALVGAPGDDTSGPAAGGARVFVLSGTSWALEATFVAPGLSATDFLGSSVALSSDGSRALVGAYSDTTAAGSDAGSVRVFQRTGVSWAQEALLLAADGAADDNFGWSIALSADGSRAIVGAYHDDTVAGSDAGSAHVFLRTGTSWAEEATLLHPAAAAGDAFGSSVALDVAGSRALVGAYRDDTPGGADAGSAGVFVRSGSGWAHEATLLAASGAAGDQFGWSAALTPDGSRALLGANRDVTGTRGGSARVFVLRSADGDGTPCSSAATCLSGICVDGVCCASACSGGTADCQACSAALTGGPSGVCAPLSPSVAPTVTCRSSAGVCDVPEVCSPASTMCPSNGFEGTSTVCRASASACDAPEYCTGTSAACPALNAPAAAGFVCRPSTGACDLAESCDGLSFVCPGDARVPLGVVCRSVADLCDTQEVCDGASAACPADGFRDAGASCRASTGTCDVEDTCSGSGPSCPDVLRPAGTECAPSSGAACDAPDVCTGTSADCVPTFLAGVECRASRGGCDLAEVCGGASATCPPDQVSPAGTVCRAASDDRCDPEEACDGSATACPADVTSCAPEIDAGPRLDGGAIPDSGTPDAAAHDDAGGPVAATGCTCRVGRSLRGARLAGLLVLVLGALWGRASAGRRARRIARDERGGRRSSRSSEHVGSRR